ncbi:hypothetical protein BST96_15155 [Oceanicoccus sagamiensis]|uniref:Regulator SirB n=2 Tax=Oceanicoccus sagamiensis TaxID=716816 RepID=A0A1X9NG12_9GAMM|nr:hypothetical protein BST96_15155 [Oceanicoccus sagamiensis]
MQLYPTIKLLHITTAVITILCFTYRGARKVNDGHYRPAKWLRIVPHINDTVLLSCAIYLATQSRQYPLTTDWVSAKLLALFAYIGLGMVVMRLAKNQQQRIIAFGLALVCFAYIVAVALSRSPTPWL